LRIKIIEMEHILLIILILTLWISIPTILVSFTKFEKKNLNIRDKSFTLSIDQFEKVTNNLDKNIENSRIVRVTAYNSVIEQCDSDPFIAAWGDKLEPGMRIVAISRDLEKIGLRRGTEIHIEKLGKFKVLDRMNKDKRNQIDVYMGLDINKAIRFGSKNLRITWKRNKNIHKG